MSRELDAAVAAADGAALLTHNTRDFVGVQDHVTVLDASR
jgi:predicted nucleic acid-binding protein